MRPNRAPEVFAGRTEQEHTSGEMITLNLDSNFDLMFKEHAYIGGWEKIRIKFEKYSAC
jgi:hypothetical protein